MRAGGPWDDRPPSADARARDAAVLIPTRTAHSEALIVRGTGYAVEAPGRAFSRPRGRGGSLGPPWASFVPLFVPLLVPLLCLFCDSFVPLLCLFCSSFCSSFSPLMFFCRGARSALSAHSHPLKRPLAERAASPRIYFVSILSGVHPGEARL